MPSLLRLRRKPSHASTMVCTTSWSPHSAAGPKKLIPQCSPTLGLPSLRGFLSGTKTQMNQVQSSNLTSEPWVSFLATSRFFPDLPRLSEVDLNGQLTTASLALQYFNRQPIGPNGFRGKIIFTASLLGYYPIATMPMYATAKAGILHFMRSAAMYYADKGITVNAGEFMADNVSKRAQNSLFYS